MRVGYTPKIEEKRWSVDFERQIIETWKHEDWWRYKEGEKVFVIDTPPPYPAPLWHLGAAISYTMQDFIARSRRMMGYSVLYPMCMDGNGLPIEYYLEKYEKVDPFSMDREAFVKLCRETLRKWKENMKNIQIRYLISSDHREHYYETDMDEYRKFTQLTFKLLWERGYIYEDKRPNIWCPKCRTTIAQSEVEYKEEKGKLYIIRYISEDGEEVPVATTRPELLAGCMAVLVHPEDDRYKHLHGKKVKVPLYDREVPVIPHPSVDPSFGTGVMHLCSFGDMDDVRLFRELKLTSLELVDKDGRLTEAAGKELAGLTTKEAREKIVELLKEKGLLIEEREITHNVPLHERCNTPVEIVTMEELYLKQVEFKRDLMKIADEMEFIPDRYRNHLKLWIESVSMDWPISRRRFYGTEVPLWTCKKCGYKLVKGGEKYWRPWKEDPGERCPKCGAEEWEGDKRVLDTWMDSSITILFITGWNRNPSLFERAWRGIKLRPQGYDIIRTWLYYTILRVFQLTGDKAFDMVFINGMGLDKHGRKMSKRYGNVIDPMEVVEKYGADAIRLWLAMEASPGENYRVNEEKIAGMQRFVTKLWNIARYVSMFPYPERPPLRPIDKWILSEINKLTKEVISYYEEFRFNEAAKRLYSFTWNIFADHYIELTKGRAKGEGWNEEDAKAAWWTLHTALKYILLLFAPIIPAITDTIWRKLYGKGPIHAEIFPAPIESIEDLTGYTEKIRAFDSMVWKTKKERGIKFYEPIEGIDIPEELEIFREDLIKAHKILSP